MSLQTAEEIEGDITYLQAKFEEAQKQLYDCRKKVEVALKGLQEAEKNEKQRKLTATPSRPSRRGYDWDDYESDSDEENASNITGEDNNAYKTDDPGISEVDDQASTSKPREKRHSPVEVAQLRIACTQVRAEAARLEQIVAQRQDQLNRALASFRKRMKKAEADLLRASEFGDTYAVRVILKGNTDLNSNVTDVLGRTPLRLAVKNDNLEIMDMLLEISSPKNVYESLLLSISLDNDQISETILRHDKYEQYKEGNWVEEEEPARYTRDDATLDDSLFSSDISPLMLAAHRNQFNIVRKLLMRGEVIAEPHDYNCSCLACTASVLGDDLRHAKTRLHAYRGLASEAYISLSSRDPLLSAFVLGHKLRKLAAVEKHFKAEYTELALQLSEFAVKLLDHVRAGHELDVILNESERSGRVGFDQLSRLKLAMKFGEKKFVAHATCQKKLTSIWYKDLKRNENNRVLTTFLQAVTFTVCYPFIFVLYWIHPWSRIGDLLRIPMVKFVAHSASYLVFLLFIILYTLTEIPAAPYTLTTYPYFNGMRALYEEYVENVTSRGGTVMLRDVIVRPHYIGYGTYVICIWIVGMAFKSIINLYRENIFVYANNFYHFMDFMMQACYGASFTLRILVSLKVQASLRYFTSRAAWEALCDCQTCALQATYWLNADRFYWDRWDPYNVSEALFAVANVISWVRLSYLLAVNEKIGPLQITFRRLLLDVSKFMSLFALFIVAYLLGFMNLFWYYDAGSRSRAELGRDAHNPTNLEKNFGTIFNTLRTIFWAIFGMAESDMVEFGDEWMRQTGGITTAVAYLLFSTYSLLTVILLVNMLIAIMARSYEIIIEDEDVNWKFARTKLYMDYIRDGDTIAVPFNLIPTWKTLYDLCRGCCENYNPEAAPWARTYDVDVGLHSLGIDMASGLIKARSLFLPKDRENGDVLGRPLTKYEQIMRKVVKRYISQGQTSDSKADDAANDDILKRDISNFRYEVMSALRGQYRHSSDLGNSVSAVEKNLLEIKDQFDHLVVRLDEADKANDEFKSKLSSDQDESREKYLGAVDKLREQLEQLRAQLDALRMRLDSGAAARPAGYSTIEQTPSQPRPPHSYTPQQRRRVEDYVSTWRSSAGVPLATSKTPGHFGATVSVPEPPRTFQAAAKEVVKKKKKKGERDDEEQVAVTPVEIPKWAQPTSDDSDSEVSSQPGSQREDHVQLGEQAAEDSDEHSED